MSRGIRNARLAFVVFMVVVAALVAALCVMGLVTGKWEAALTFLPTAVGFRIATRVYEADPEYFHKRMSGREIAVSVWPVALILAALAAAVVVDRLG
jgi:hypothetical protein